MRFKKTKHPVIYEINVRTWLWDLSARYGKPITLGNVPEQDLDQLFELKIDLVWLMGVWSSGPRGIEIAGAHPGLQEEYRRVLGDFALEDVSGSPYSIADYTVAPWLGGPEALAAFRRNLAKRDLGLVLDFVVNHTGVDHPWVRERPEYYVQGSEEELAAAPENFFGVETDQGRKILAHGRDPYYPGWTDTAQLNFLHPGLRAALRQTLRDLASQCDGVRCDMAMLSLESVFRETWGDLPLASLDGAPAAGEIWPELIAATRAEHPGFLFLAEVYWGLESRIRSLGFDYTYDKVLYERLLGGSAREVRDHLQGDVGYQQGGIRFLENHDEPRAAAAFPWERHRAAAVIASTVPGMVLFQEGQFEGRRLKLPIQLRRRPQEDANPEIRSFYKRLLEVLEDPIFQAGRWLLLPTSPAWQGNATAENFICHLWDTERGGTRLVTVNFAAVEGQCFVHLPSERLAEKHVQFHDLFSNERFSRRGSELAAQGLYLDVPGFAFHVFELALFAGEPPGPQRFVAPFRR